MDGLLTAYVREGFVVNIQKFFQETLSLVSATLQEVRHQMYNSNAYDYATFW